VSHHILLVIAVVGDPLLPAMGRVIGPIEVDHNAVWLARSSSLVQIDLQQPTREPVAGLSIDGILQAREGRVFR
jgi:hypothetical protein